MLCLTASLCTRPQGTQYVVVYSELIFACQLFLQIEKIFFARISDFFESDDWRGFHEMSIRNWPRGGQLRPDSHANHRRIF